MPRVHEAFEQTAAMLSPYSYPELEGAMMTAGIILEQHIPKNNMEGITGSTETLVTKAGPQREDDSRRAQGSAGSSAERVPVVMKADRADERVLR